MDDLTRYAKPETRAAGRSRGWAKWLLAVLVALAVGYYLLARGGSGAAQKTATVPPEPVSVAAVAPADISVVLDGLGAVTPLATVNVVPEVSGQIMQIGFQEGQMVHQGDFLLQIDPRPFQVALQTAQGTLARDQALLGEARVDLARYQKLAKLQSIAAQQAEDQSFLVKQYAGAVVTDQAAIASANLNLTYAHITAPIEGRVGLRQVDLGNFVQSSATTPLVVITQLQPISVEFTLPEDDIPEIERQMHAGTLAVEAYDRSDTGRLASGTLGAIDTEVSNTTGTVTIRAMFDNKDNALFPQQFVNAHLLLKRLVAVPSVPNAAVQHGAPGAFVYRLAADGTVRVVPVLIGAADGSHTQILHGLSVGDRVVTDGVDRLRDGAKVQVADPPAGH